MTTAQTPVATATALTPAPTTRPDVRERRKQALFNLLAAWSLTPGDEFAKLTHNGSRQGRLLTYLPNPETLRGELLTQRPSFQTRLDQRPGARLPRWKQELLAVVTPNVCTALPLAGGLLVPTQIVRY